MQSYAILVVVGNCRADNFDPASDGWSHLTKTAEIVGMELVGLHGQLEQQLLNAS